MRALSDLFEGVARLVNQRQNLPCPNQVVDVDGAPLLLQSFYARSLQRAASAVVGSALAPVADEARQAYSGQGTRSA